MNPHVAWLWLWETVGALLYMLKRAHYLIAGPNPIASTYKEFFKVAGIPLLFRWGVESAIFWFCFSPVLLEHALEYMGWTKWGAAVGTVTQYAVMAFAYGVSSDTLVDWFASTLVNKIPLLKDWWPQFPPPLPPTAKQAQVKADAIADQAGGK